jgi:hypothetical protein
MAKRKRAAARQAGKLLAMDTATASHRELIGTTEAAKILGVGVGYLRKLARDGDIWSDVRFGERCPVYDAVELNAFAQRMQDERAAGKRAGRPPSGGPKS